MLILRLHKFLTDPTTKTSSVRVLFWFSLSLTVAAAYGYRSLQRMLESEYVVQDDMRQHVFWMRRFLDPELFPQDLIANYHQSVSPFGYFIFHQMMASVGVDPILLSKFLPLVLGLIATGYCFGVCLQILPVPLAGFAAALLLNQSLWIQSDLVSGTPRAFLYPLFLAFLYYLLRRSLLPMLAAVLLQGLFYPPFLLIFAGVLLVRLLNWEDGVFRLSPNREDYIFCAAGVGTILLMLLPYLLNSSEFGPTLTRVEARALPELSATGRKEFFLDSPWNFWVCGRRSGILPKEWCSSLHYYFPLLLGIALLLPLLLHYPRHFPLAEQVTKRIAILPQIALVSFAWFFAAHALLFKLYLPSRYTQHSMRILMALGAAIALTLLLDALLHWAQQQTHLPLAGRQVLALGATAIFAIALVLHPVSLRLKNQPTMYYRYRVGEVPELYEFFSKQPKDSLIASLTEEANNLPTFAQRSILVGSEYSNPYHMGYYRKFRQRAVDLVRAQYSQDLAEVKRFIQTYDIDFWLLDKAAFTPDYITADPWIHQFQTEAEALTQLKQGDIPALAGLVKRCNVFEAQQMVVLQADCIAKAPQE